MPRTDYPKRSSKIDRYENYPDRFWDFQKGAGGIDGIDFWYLDDWRNMPDKYQWLGIRGDGNDDTIYEFPVNKKAFDRLDKVHSRARYFNRKIDNMR